MNELRRIEMHEAIDRQVNRGWAGLLLLGASPIVADVVSGWIGATLAAIGGIMFLRAWIKLV